MLESCKYVCIYVCHNISEKIKNKKNVSVYPIITLEKMSKTENTVKLQNISYEPILFYLYFYLYLYL